MDDQEMFAVGYGSGDGDFHMWIFRTAEGVREFFRDWLEGTWETDVLNLAEFEEWDGQNSYNFGDQMQYYISLCKVEG